MNTNFSYRKDIDGLRALAILPVLFFHAGLGFTGGYVGVDVFFVISGYLITKIIAREIQAGTFTYRRFWERRIRRIFPAAFSVTLTTFVIGLLIFLPPEVRSLSKAALSQVLMGANFYFWQQDGYFAGPSELEPYLQMWSLAVEEQFYLILPFLLTFLLKRGARNTVIWLTIIATASFAWSCYGVFNNQAATFFLLPSRAWELLSGSLLAFLPSRKNTSGATQHLTATLGLGLILGPVFFFDKTTLFPGPSALLPCLGTLFLIRAHEDASSWVKPILTSKYFVRIGKISFSLYLWHWPLLVFSRHWSLGEPPTTTRLILFFLSFAIAILSWRFIEQPFRDRKWLAHRPVLFRKFIQITIGSALVFTVVYKLDGFPQRFDGNHARYVNVVIERPKVPSTDLSTGKFPLVLEDNNNPKAPILLWGDSHAKCLIESLAVHCRKYQINCFYAAKGATPPLLEANFYPQDQTVAPFNDQVLELIDQEGIKTVVLAARWTRYLKQGELSRQTSLTDRNSAYRHPDLVLEDTLRLTINALEKRNIRVFVVRQAPLQDRNPASALWISSIRNLPTEKLGIAIEEHSKHQARANHAIDKAAEDTSAAVLDPLTLLSMENGHTRVELDHEIFYFDENHLSKAGAKFVSALFTEVFSEFQSR